MKRPYYTNRPIASIRSLSRALEVNKSRLRSLNDNAGDFYVLNKVEKPDGTYRETYNVIGDLAEIQSRIVERIIRSVRYPPYLRGAIYDNEDPRSDITNAAIHAGRRVIIKADIDNFFPSVKVSVVMDIWQYFFDFPGEIAEILTRLTTYQGALPQGASTSPGLANLVFYDTEPRLVAELDRLGFRYTRYIDDITISTDDHVDIAGGS